MRVFVAFGSLAITATLALTASGIATKAIGALAALPALPHCASHFPVWLPAFVMLFMLPGLLARARTNVNRAEKLDAER